MFKVTRNKIKENQLQCTMDVLSINKSMQLKSNSGNKKILSKYLSWRNDSQYRVTQFLGGCLHMTPLDVWVNFKPINHTKSNQTQSIKFKILLKNSTIMSQQEKVQNYPHEFQWPKLYELIEINNENSLIRPVVSYTNTHLRNLAVHLNIIYKDEMILPKIQHKKFHWTMQQI